MVNKKVKNKRLKLSSLSASHWLNKVKHTEIKIDIMDYN